MKPKIVAIFAFLVLFLGVQVQSFAQASASVRYTIVVSDDIFADNDRGIDQRNQVGNYRFQQNNVQEDYPSSVAISMHAGFGNDNMETLTAFEIEMSTEQTPAVREALYRQIEAQADVKSFYNEDDQYLVVLEYN